MKLPAAPLAIAALALALSIGTYAADSTSGRKLSGNDRHFISLAAEGGMAEIELGKLAQQNGARPAVKQFGRLMIEDHSKANQALEAVVAELGATMPTAPGKKHQSDFRKLAKLTGERFDREYINHMVKDHEKDVSVFEKQASKGDAEALRRFAARTLPTLQEHLRLVKAMKDSSRK